MESAALSSPQLLPTDPPEDEASGWAQGLGIEQGRDPAKGLWRIGTRRKFLLGRTEVVSTSVSVKEARGEPG